MAANKMPPRNPFADRDNEMIVSAPGTLQGADISISDLTGCDVFIMDHTSAIYVDQCTDCRIRIGPVAGFCFVRNCTNCILSIACQQFRSKECKELTVFLFAGSDPHLEMCKDITIGPYNFAYPLQDRHFKAAGLNPMANLWSQVYDHTPSNSDDQNWTMLEPQDFIPLEYRIDELGEPIDPVQKPSLFTGNGVDGVIVKGSQVHSKFKGLPPRVEEDDSHPDILQELEQGKLADAELDAPNNETTYLPQDWKEARKAASPRLPQTPGVWGDVDLGSHKAGSPRLESKRSPRLAAQLSAAENPLLRLQKAPAAGDVQALVLYIRGQEFQQEVAIPGYILPPESLPQSLHRASATARPYHEQLRLLTLSGFCVLLAGLFLLLALILISDFVDLDDGGLAIQLFLLIVATVALLVYIAVRIRKVLTAGNQDFQKVLEEETVTTYSQCGLALTGDLFSVQIMAKPKDTLQALLR